MTENISRLASWLLVKQDNGMHPEYLVLKAWFYHLFAVQS